MKRIKLTQDKFVLVDDEDFDRLNQFKWQAHKISHIWYATRDYQKNNNKKKVYMHREIMGNPEGKEIDHKNMNGLDNRKNNLRICRKGQNRFNMRAIGGSSKYRSVYWRPDRKKWVAQIRYNYKTKCIGLYENEEDAAWAYDFCAIGLFGEFARLNLTNNQKEKAW